MAGNTRFATAIHVAGMLSLAEEMPITSDNIAQSCNTNPVVIRRIIGLLAKNGLVQVKMGTGGGASLTKKPEEISLGDLYRALDEGPLFEVPQFEKEYHCELGKSVRPLLAGLLQDAETTMLYSLDKTNLADVIQQVKKSLAENPVNELS